MRKLLSLTLAILMILSVLPLSVLNVGAETVTSGVTGDCTWTLDGTVLTISGNGEMGSYNNYYTKPQWPTTITQVVIEEGVTSIGSWAFKGCFDIKDFTLAKSVKYIYDYAFNEAAIENLYVDDLDNWLSMEYISKVALQNVEYLHCDGEVIRDFVIPKGTTKIKENTFSGYKELKSVTFPNSPITVSDNAFYGCENIESVYISDLTAWIKSDFLGADIYYKRGYHSFTMDHCYSNPLRYADNLYLNGDIVQGEIVIPNGITEIGQGVFCGYNRIKKVTIADSVKRINDAAFEACTNLEEVKFGKNTVVIALLAFNDCTSLKKITLYNKIDAIGYYAFGNCTSLKDVWFSGVKDEYLSIRYHEPYNSDYENGVKYFKSAKWHFNTNKTLAKVKLYSSWDSPKAWFLYENNKRSRDTTLVKYEGKWFYVSYGRWYNNYNTVTKYNGKLFYIKNGKWKQDYKGLGYYNSSYYYFKNGKVDKNKTGFVSYKGRVYYIKNGKQSEKSQILKYNGKEYFFKNGVKSTYTGILRHNGKWYYLKKGVWSKEKAIVRYIPKKVEIKKGVYIRSYYLEGYKGELFYVNNGYAQLDFSGTVRVDGKTYKIKNGIVV